MVFKLRFARPLAALTSALILAASLTACAYLQQWTPARAGRAQPEAIVVAANPHASAAGAEILRRGGSATDAAIATMAVLGLVEPQSSGLGGGAFLLHYDSARDTIDAYDGREIAPAGATPDMFLDANGAPLSRLDAITSGRAIGVPSLIPMLKLAHEQHGHLPWAELFEPAIALAENGFEVSPRLHRLIAAVVQFGRLQRDPAARAYLLTANGQPLPVGHLLRNPDYAATLRAIAAQGPAALQSGPIADAIVAQAHSGPLPGTLTLADLQSARPRRLDAICGRYRIYRVCSMPPPSSGGIAVIETLALYERARPHPAGAAVVDDWAAYLWASRLAYTDRDFYVGDDQFVPVPIAGLLNPRYNDVRAQAIHLDAAPAEPLAPGDPSATVGGQSLLNHWQQMAGPTETGTSHFTVLDFDGNVVSMTATVESVFGSQRMAGGFFLNNQLTDFSFQPTEDGRPVANAVAPGKRPRSSMAPILMFNANDGDFHAALGSPGGGAIISYVARTIIASEDWGLSLQEAFDLPHLISASPEIRMETGFPQSIADSLAARGWAFRPAAAEDSGLHGFRVTPSGIETAIDQRREGTAERVPRRALMQTAE